jgi:hypothetical protein
VNRGVQGTGYQSQKCHDLDAAFYSLTARAVGAFAVHVYQNGNQHTTLRRGSTFSVMDLPLTKNVNQGTRVQ